MINIIYENKLYNLFFQTKTRYNLGRMFLSFNFINNNTLVVPSLNHSIFTQQGGRFLKSQRCRRCRRSAVFTHFDIKILSFRQGCRV